MKQQQKFNLVRWFFSVAVTFCCVYAISKYITPAGLPIIVLNAIVPFFILFFFKKDTINRIGIFLLCTPVIFLSETAYILIMGLSLPLNSAVNLLTAIFTTNLLLFAIMGQYFTGSLKNNLDKYLYPLLLLNILAYSLIYSKYPFNLTPYVALVIVLAGFYKVMVKQIRSRERMIAEQCQTTINTRFMACNIIHDISNLVASIYGWSDLALSAQDMEKRNQNKIKAELLFHHATEHIKTITSMLRDEKNIVSLSHVSPSVFCDGLFQFLKDSFVGDVRQMKGKQAEFINKTLVFALPASLSGKWVYADAKAFNNAVLNLVINAQKAGAGGIIVHIEETDNPKGLQFRIRDNGRGVPKEKVNLLFKERVNSETGSGVGLLGVRMIVNCHNASIQLTKPNSDGKEYTEFLISSLAYIDR